VPLPEGAIVPWDIVRVDFPFADETTTRHRPAVVIATPSATDRLSILWVLMITSAAQGRWPLDIPVSDLRLGGLSHPCVVRTSKVTALDSRLAVRIGELAAADRVAVTACLRDLLGSVLTG